MKLVLSITFPALLFLAACSGSTETQLEEIKANAAEIDLTKTDYTFKVNQKSYLEMSEHGSVGLGSEVSIADNSIIAISGDVFNYDNVSEGEVLESGGDGGTRTYAFTALKKGTTTITARNYIRGALQKENVLNITVE